MTTGVLPGEQRFLLHNVDWNFYDLVLQQVGDQRVFVTYDRGRIELMSPSPRHESYAKLIARMLEMLTLELDIPIRSARSTTFRREDLERGLEPDECYYIRNEAKVRHLNEIDLTRDPPPDLVVEVEISRRLLDREAIYAALGVPELWRFDGQRMRIQVLQPDGQYADSAASPSLPMLPVHRLVEFLNQPRTVDENSLIRNFRDWVRRGIP